MKPKKIFIIRHGESEGNVSKDIYTKIPDYAIYLTDKGKAQASEAGKKIAEIIKYETFGIYYSPYFRSRQTMDEAMQYLTIQNCRFKHEEVRMREQEYSGRLRKEDFENNDRDEYGKFFYRNDGGESGSDVWDRTSDFIGALHRDFEKINYPENALIFGHGFTNRIFLMKYLHITVEEFETYKNPRNGEIHILELGIDNKYKLITEIRKHTMEKRLYNNLMEARWNITFVPLIC